MAHIKHAASAETSEQPTPAVDVDLDDADDSGIADTADLVAASSDAEDAEEAEDSATPTRKRAKIEAEDDATPARKHVKTEAKAGGAKTNSSKANSSKANSAKAKSVKVNGATEPEPATPATPATAAPATAKRVRVRKTTSRDVENECYGRLLAAVRKLHKEFSFEFNSGTAGVLAVGDVADSEALRIFTFSITDGGAFIITDYDGNVAFRVLSRPSAGYAVQLLARSLFAALDRACACE